MDARAALAHARWRTRNLRLTGERCSTPEDVVDWLCAVQSQDYGPAKWSVALRSKARYNDARMDLLFNDGAILRTHVLRPTWHFVLPKDIRWMLTATAPRVHAVNRPRYRELGLDERTLQRGAAFIADAIAGGTYLTRKEIAEVLEADGIATDGQRLAYLLMYAELEAVVCSGPLKGKQHTYALLEERAPRAIVMQADEALAELTYRYFKSHGPASAKDFAAWASLSLAQVRIGLDAVGWRLEREIVDGVQQWFTEPAPRRTRVSAKVTLMQAYDEYFMGYSQTRGVIDVVGVDPATRPSFNGALLLGTQVVGHWKRTLVKDGLLIDVLLYPPNAGLVGTAALDAAAHEYAAYLGATGYEVRSQIIER